MRWSDVRKRGTTRCMRSIAVAGSFIALLLAMLIVGYLVLDTSESAGPEAAVTLSDVVEQPERYEGERVTVSGEWADNEHFKPANAEQVVVLGDDAGATLVVVPQLGVDVPEVDVDSSLRVTGIVRLSERAAAGFVAPGGLLNGGDGPAPIIAADHVELTDPPPDPIAREAVTASVEQLLRDPENFEPVPVLVSGRVSAVGGRGFVMTQNGASIFVSAPTKELDHVEDGARVRVRAELARLSDYGAQQLKRALGSEKVTIAVGRPYLLLRAVEESA